HVSFEYLNWQQDQNSLVTHAAEFLLKPFQLDREPLLRFQLIDTDKLEHHSYTLLFAFHHIIADGWSIDIFIKDLIGFYQHYAFAAEKPKPLAYQFQDYAWTLTSQPSDHQQLEYWQQRLQNSQLTELPFQFTRPEHLDSNGKQLGFEFGKELTARLKAFAHAEQTSLFNVLQSGFCVLLAHYSGQNDITLGSPVANREQLASQEMIGLFANTLALRTEIDQSSNFRELLAQVTGNNLNDFAHQAINFEDLVDALDIPRLLNQTPLFNVMLVLQANSQAASNTMLTGPLSIESIDDLSLLNSAKFDLTLNVLDQADNIKANLEYRTALFSDAFIEKFADDLKRSFDLLLNHAEQALHSLPLPAAEINSIQNNNEHWDKLSNYSFMPFIQRFESLCELHAEQVAVIDSKQRLDFNALNQAANQLAHYLLQQHTALSAEDCIAICIPRSAELLIALLAAQKTGAHFLAIDVGLPAKRIEFMLSDSAAKSVITSAATADFVDNQSFSSGAIFDAIAVNIDMLKPQLAEFSSDNPERPIHAGDLAYILYTSGSTGQPKGTEIEQLGLDNYLQFASNYYYPHATQSVVSSSISFDATITSLYSGLLHGFPCLFTAQDDDRFTQLYQEIFNSSTPSLFKLTPAHIELLTSMHSDQPACKIAHTFVIGGEQLTTSGLQNFAAILPSAYFINEYGPTETVVGCSVEFIDQDTDWQLFSRDIPIGRAISNTQLLVLDPYLRPVPHGSIGELYIAGFGVGRAYKNRTLETEQAFLSHPLISSADVNVSNIHRLYKTGDRVKYIDDHRLQYLSRIDEQIKIRGLRIEPAEIEHALQQLNHISESCIIVKGEGAEQQLAAFYSTDTQQAIDDSSIVKQLATRLPRYMLPTSYTWLETLPLSHNGKIDKQQLATIDIASEQKAIVTAANQTEQKIHAIWCSILATDAVSTNQSFFHVGGHSLLAIRLLAAIEAEFQVSLLLNQLFEYPTIQAQADLIERQLSQADANQALPSIQAIDRNSIADIPLSFNQQRLWFIYQLEPQAANYNIPTALKISGKLDLKALEQAANYLLERHELLRTTFTQAGDSASQIIHPASRWPFDFNDSTILSLDADISNESIITLLQQHSQLAFNLLDERLIRISLWQQTQASGDDVYYVLINLHHIIADAISLQQLVTELLHCYAQFTNLQQPLLPAQKIQYADYAMWQQQIQSSDFLQQQLDWWQAQLIDAPSILNLPTDHQRPQQLTHHGDIIVSTIAPKLSQKIRQFCIDEGLTPFILLLATQQLLLGRLANQDDVCIGVPLAGRHHAGTEQLLGFFINALVMRADFNDNPTSHDYLRYCKQQVLAAFAHQDAPFEQVIQRLQLEQNAAHAPLVQVGFNYIHQTLSPLQQLSELQAQIKDAPTVEPLTLAHNDAKYEQIWAFLDDGQDITLTLEFNTALFNQQTMLKWVDCYQHLLAELMDSADIPVKRLKLASQDQLLESLHLSSLGYNNEQLESILPLTPLQRDMYIDQMVKPDNRQNYLGWVQHSNQLIDADILQQALDIIVQHCAALRMRIISCNNPLFDNAYQI
ncbi:MAG: amino acid adenylation domain-containing protein, partial [Pseudomonadales bacterium]|nr:amino acid adenylation domain-containing protein [Pseudomonadales bacterium]